MIKTNKTGVYYNLLEDKDKVFYFTYNDVNDNKKKKWVKVGKYSDGIREINAFNLRAEQISKMKHGKDITVIANKKKVNAVTYDDLAQIYFKDKNVHQHRINKYNIHIKPSIGNKDIHSITKSMIKKILDDVIAKGRANQTVNGIRELTGAIFNHNIKEHNLQLINPCNGISRLKVDNDRERYLSVEEIKLIKQYFKDNFLLSLFIDLSLQTGGRFETILLVQKKDINLTTGTITLYNTKTKTTYTGFLQSDLIEQLKEYLSKLKANDYLISYENQHNIKLNQSPIKNKIQPVLNKLFNDGLSADDSKNRVVIHTFRHSFASHLAINGVPIFTIQKLMNHKKIEQTLRYAKLSPENGKNAIEGLYR
jgi:integrase